MANRRSAGLRSGAVAGPTLVPAGDQDDAANKRIEAFGERVGLTGVLGNLDRVAREVGTLGSAEGCGYAWDERDATTKQWWPQGLTTTAEAGPATAARLGGPVVFAAWYAKRRWRGGEGAVRLAVLDLRDERLPRYSHVLLVEPYRSVWSRRWRHRDVAVHAGGLVWVDDRLLVADTRDGFRVFDTRDVVAVPPGTRAARGCPYLLPQRGRWRASTIPGVRPMRWSFASRDRTELGGDWLIAGEYAASGTGARIVRLPLEPLLAGEPAESVEVVTPAIRSMQGAARVGGRYWVSASRGSRRRGHLWHGGPGEAFAKFEQALPIGPEDVSYDVDRRCLWTQTEHPGHRFVLCVPLPPVG